nr:AAA family ATPase [Rhodopseudomonas julia]
MFVVTGGPGSGKTALIEALAAAGPRTMPEAGRAIIRDQVQIGGSALPWADRSSFAELMLSWELRSHREALALSGPVVMDRGVPDVMGYLRLCGLSVPQHVQHAAELFRYNRRVFLAPWWPEIFAQDEERKQDPAEARETGAVMERTYSDLGYEIVRLPYASIEDRAAFVLECIAT